MLTARQWTDWRALIIALSLAFALGYLVRMAFRLSVVAASVFRHGAQLAIHSDEFVFVAINCRACAKATAKHFLLSAMTCPIYWLLTSVGALWGAIELVYNPFHWSKTARGLTPSSQADQVNPLPDDEVGAVQGLS